jgi:polysaccharide deacetylase 2 family uncharacterized protein YibQ
MKYKKSMIMTRVPRNILLSAAPSRDVVPRAMQEVKNQSNIIIFDSPLQPMSGRLVSVRLVRNPRSRIAL